MRKKERRGFARLLCLGAAVLLFSLAGVRGAIAAEAPPYEFDAELSLTGGCTTNKADEIPDPGCPEKKPPKPFSNLRGIAVDSFGDEYVASYGAEEGKQGRIDVFSPKGIFITEVKDELGPKGIAVDSKGNLYAFEHIPGNGSQLSRFTPTTYKPGEEEIEYGSGEVFATDNSAVYGSVSVDAKNDHVFAAIGSNSIKEYGPASEGNKLLETITNERLFAVTFVTVDAQRRRLYVSSCPNVKSSECWVLVLNADKPHELLKEVEGPNPPEQRFASEVGWTSIAVNEESGDFFVGDIGLTTATKVYQFDESYELVSTLTLNSSLFEGGEPLQIAVSNAPEGTRNSHYLFVPSIKSPNRALAFSPPKCQSPVIESALASGIGENEVELQTLIKPRGCVTTYRLEYLSQQEYEEAGNSFEGAQVAGEGTIQPAEQEAEVSAPIGGLEPGTTYRFRVSANNETEGKGGKGEKEATFATYENAPITSACENQELRLAHSALLPDCRVYELVTPADTNGHPTRGIGFIGDRFPTVEVSPDGNTVSFLTEGGSIPGLGGAGGFYGDLYQANRKGSGWASALAGPHGSETSSPDPGSTSSDQGYSFWGAENEGSAVIEGEETHYVRYPDGHSALVGRGSEGTDPKARGRLITENGTHVVFDTRSANGKQPQQLEPNAPPTGTTAVYDRTADEVTHVVSLLPGDETPKAGENAVYVGASTDGEGIAFSIGNRLYLRVANTTTYEIGIGVTFAGVSEEGGRIFYVKGGDLFAFDTASEEVIQFTEVGNAIPVNIAADGTRAYFASTTAIVGSGENPNGAVAEEGKDKENLYLSEEGATRFVATVTERDLVGEEIPSQGQTDGLGLWSSSLVAGQLVRDPSRTTPDGDVLLFSSRADLDGYAHEGVPEIYRFDSAGERLHCISCLPTRTPASGGATLQSFIKSAAAGETAPPFSSFGFVPGLRADGRRAFFQSSEALVSTDNDGVQDVYEWEEAGEGSCNRPGGCVYLISSGHSVKDNFLYAVSSSGNDVFFTTSDLLVGNDDNTVSIYDARVGGGFAEGDVPCPKLAEECPKSTTPTPLFPAPESEGLPASPPPVKRCPKGKHKATRNGKQVCVKNKKKHHRNHHTTKKGAGK